MLTMPYVLTIIPIEILLNTKKYIVYQIVKIYKEVLLDLKDL